MAAYRHDAGDADRLVHHAAGLCLGVPGRAVRDHRAVHDRARAGDRGTAGQWISMFTLTNIPVHVNDVIFGEVSEITEDAPARDAAGRDPGGLVLRLDPGAGRAALVALPEAHAMSSNAGVRVIRVDGVSRWFGSVVAVSDVTLRRHAGHHRPARPQRRRQDHAAPHDDRARRDLERHGHRLRPAGARQPAALPAHRRDVGARDGLRLHEGPRVRAHDGPAARRAEPGGRGGPGDRAGGPGRRAAPPDGHLLARHAAADAARRRRWCTIPRS